MKIEFCNTYAQLPPLFFESINPTPVPNPELIIFNKDLAIELGIEAEDTEDQDIANIFAGNTLLSGSEPIALAYAGHQFGHFVPQLGDGRAILLGEVIDKFGERRDIQLKGAGITSFSRRGDGRSALGPAIREYLLSEAMHFLGIPSTRSLALVKTGEEVFRTGFVPGGISTRVASSHIRIGTFEYFAARQDWNSLEILADYSLKRHYPKTNNYWELLEAIALKQASLIAKWMSVGFVHGVMNTDNTAISGETIDFGPCAFLEEYKSAAVFSSIDTNGRYSYQNQPLIMQWNLKVLIQCFLPHLLKTTQGNNLQHEESDLNETYKIAEQIIKKFNSHYEEFWLTEMCKKIGILEPKKEDRELIFKLLTLMEENYLDFTLTFRSLAYLLNDTSNSESEEIGKTKLPIFNSINWHLTDFLETSSQFIDWKNLWLERLKNGEMPLNIIKNNMNLTNPIFIPRNHLVENVINKAILNNDFREFYNLQTALKKPFEEQVGFEQLSTPAKEYEKVYETFCGT